MGLALTMSVSHNDTFDMISVDFPRDKYNHLGIITGMRIEKLAQEGWSQLVDRETARRIAEVVGYSGEWSKLVNQFTPCCIIRATIA